MKKKLVFLSITLLVILSSVALTYTIGFKDVTNDKWYWEDVHKISDYGIMSGFKDGTFKPNEYVTRAELSSIILSTIDYMEDKQQAEIETGVNTILSKTESIVYIETNGNYGSGVIIDSEGLILTAYHVVNSSKDDNVNISIYGEDDVTVGKIVYVIKELDLALIKIDAKNLNYVSISDKYPNVLDNVYAIGNPFEMVSTITSGKISKLDVKRDTMSCSVMTIDATVNYGNSGSALINTDGELIGIVVMTINPERGAGIGYVVDLSSINRILYEYNKYTN